ncbi:hypothetical protein MHO82_24735 [Vibrio sp. Of7-15]|uniref:hypothetical protein n=1 Tax=Vibrio sp. Of7-15 TaxID=2724879 RepID=UPI001EF3CE0D|nr:hypothetical protein [Vibrio sp. Of7-15]MCG7500075.1 hypothetical protein [Vibrio sp. Of7-15]
MNSSTVLSSELIVSGRDIPLKELLFAKKVVHNYMLVAQPGSPVELLPEIVTAIDGIEYFKTESDTCQARNAISSMLDKVNTNSFEQFNHSASKPSQALDELIEDRVHLIKKERQMLLEAGYDVAKM